MVHKNSLANLKPFKKGDVGNPKGRPKSCRNILSEDFVKALHEDFTQHGIQAIAEVRENKTDQYLKIIASLVPKELTVNDGETAIERLLASVPDEELTEFVTGLRLIAAATGSGETSEEARATQELPPVH